MITFRFKMFSLYSVFWKENGAPASEVD